MRSVLRLALLIGSLWSSSAMAGYAQLAPPPAFQSVGGVSTINVGTAANGARYAGGHVMANASLNLGARTVTVPVAMRVAANAATFAVTKLNPWLLGLQLATLAIPFIVDWLRGSNLAVNDQGVIVVPGTTGPVTAGDIQIYNWDGVKSASQVMPGLSCPSGVITTVKTADQCMSGGMVGWWMISSCAGSWSNGWSGMYCGSGAIPQGSSTPPRAPTEDDLAPLANSPINPQALVELGIPLPVDPVPIVNPAVEPVGDVRVGPNGNPAPELAPKPEPLRYPNGEPVAIPNTNPPAYSQPWWEVTHSPTPGEPWRVIIRPVVTETNDPSPQPDPDGTTPEPKPPFDFYTDCDKFPTALACMERGDPPDLEDMPEETRTISAQAGPSFSGGGCPANVNISALGHAFQVVDMAPMCGWISGLVKPLFMLLAFISAVFIVRSAL